jgi:hypothetical protein
MDRDRLSPGGLGFIVPVLLAPRVHPPGRKQGAWDIEALEDGVVDAIIASERRYAAAKTEGFLDLADTKEWGEPIAGNSILVERGWLEIPRNREVALRFLKAAASLRRRSILSAYYTHPVVDIGSPNAPDGVPRVVLRRCPLRNGKPQEVTLSPLKRTSRRDRSWR